MFHSNQAN